MQMSLTFSEEEKRFFNIYLDLLKRYYNSPQKFSLFLELKALELNIENLKEVVEKFNEILRRYLFFKSKRQQLEEILPVTPDVVQVLKKYPYFVEYKLVKTYPTKSEYSGLKVRNGLLLAGGKDGKVRIWKLEGEEIRFLKEVGEEAGQFPKYELWGDHLLYAVGNLLKAIYLPSGKVVDSEDIGQPPEALNVEEGKVYLYKKVGNIAIKQQVGIADGKLVFGPADPVAPTQIESGELDMVALGKKLIKVKDGKIYLFEGVKKSEKINFVSVHKFNFGNPVNDLLMFKNSIIVAPSGQPPAVLDFNGNITTKLDIPISHSYRLRKHPQKNLLAVSHNQNLISVWNLDNLQPVRILESYFIDVLGLDFSPDGRFLAASGEGRDINIWDTETWEMVKDLDLPVEGIMALAFSPDGKLLAAGTSEGTIYLIDTENWNVVKELSYHSDMVSDLLFVNAKTLVSASWDGKALLWDLKKGEVEKILQSGESRVWKLALSEDKLHLAVADWDGKVSIYSTKNWEEVAYFIDKSGVTAVSFGSQHLVIGRKEGTVELVELQAEEEIGQSIVEISVQLSEKAVGVAPFNGNLVAYSEGGKLGVWDSEGRKVFGATVNGRLENVENLREPNLEVEVLPDTYIVQKDGYFFGGKGWEDYVQVLKGLEIVEDKGEFLKEVVKPDLLKEL